MKRLTALTLSLCLLLGLAGCGGSGSGQSLQDKLSQLSPPVETAPGEETQSPQTPQPGNTSSGKHKSDGGNTSDGSEDYNHYQGIYTISEPVGAVEIVLQIRAYGNMLLLEYTHLLDGSPFSFWVEEFWPDPDILEDGEYESVTGMSQSSSPLYDETGCYWSSAQSRTIILTPEGVDLQDSYGMVESFTANASQSGTHLSLDQHLANLNQLVQTAENLEPVGEWTYCDEVTEAYLYLGEDHQFLYAYKEKHTPAKVLVGAWVYDSASGDLVCSAQRIGAGDREFQFNLNWYVNDLGDLIVRDTSSEGLFSLINEVYLEPSQHDTWFQTRSMDWMMSTYGLWTGEDGFFMDSDETVYSYSYHVPFFLPTSMEQEIPLNDAIYNRFGMLAYEQLDRISQGEAPEIPIVNFESSTYKGIDMLYLWTDSPYSHSDAAVYCYDRENNASVDTPALMSLLGISEGEFLEAVRASVEDYFELQYGDLSPQLRESLYYDDMLSLNLSDQVINDTLPVFVTEQGEIAVIVPINNLIGGCTYVPLFPFAKVVN